MDTYSHSTDRQTRTCVHTLWWQRHNPSILTIKMLLLHHVSFTETSKHKNTISSYSRPEKNMVAVQVCQNRRRAIIEQSYSKPEMMSFTTSQLNCIWQHCVGSTDEKCNQIMMDGEILG